MSNNPQQQIPGVQIVGVKPDSTRNGNPIFKIQTSDGQERSTFDQGAATKAMSLVGQTGTLIVELNGKYQNYVDFLPGGAGVFGAAQGGFQPPAQQFPQGQAAPPVFVPAPDLKEKRIIRGNSLNAAAAALGPFISTGFFVSDDGKLLTEDVGGAVIKLAKQFVGYLEGADAPGDPAPVAPVLPPNVTPEQIAAWAAQMGAPVTVGVPDAAAAQDAAAEAPDVEPAKY